MKLLRREAGGVLVLRIIALLVVGGGTSYLAALEPWPAWVALACGAAAGVLAFIIGPIVIPSLCDGFGDLDD